MTYLDPNHAHSHVDWTRWVVRLFAIALVVLFGWFALTVGTDSNGAPQIVSEPASRTF